MGKRACSWCIIGSLTLLAAACGTSSDSESNRGPLNIPRGLGKADSTYSCQGKCGGNAGNCWCDDKCATYGDCCPDKAQLCDKPQPNKMCGGIANIQCPAGQKCKIAATYPDAAGTCVPETYCDTSTDCAGLIHPMCVGEWQCVTNNCSYKCGITPIGKCTENSDCKAGEYCEVGDEMCTKPTLTILEGTCTTQPTVCTKEFMPVCGCDGKSYGNACDAHAAGTSVASKGECKPQPGICGGFAGIKCPAGQKCKLDGNYPDASGKCVPQTYCDTTADCADLFHPMCVGAWQCDANTCNYKCGIIPPIEVICRKNTDCNGNEYCEFGDGKCNKPTAVILEGKCTTRPTGCTKEMMPVCGCNNQTYSTACGAHAAGTSVAKKGACKPQPGICGGFAGIKCPAGQKCKLDGTYPDASGKCVPETYCDTAADCAGLIHPMCVGDWQCVANTCSYKCGVTPVPPTPPVTYCLNKCGGQGVSGCYCDTVCEKYGDCCPDVKKYCP